MLKRRVSLLLILFIAVTMMPECLIAKSGVNKVIRCDTRDYQITTSDGLYLHLDIDDMQEYTTKCAMITLYNAEFTLDKNNKYIAHDMPVYDSTGRIVEINYETRTYYDNKCTSLMITVDSNAMQGVDIPLILRTYPLPHTAWGQITTYKEQGIVPVDTTKSWSVFSVLKGTPREEEYDRRKYYEDNPKDIPWESNTTTSSSLNISYSNSMSKSISKTYVKKDKVAKQYISKDSITPNKVKYNDIQKGSKEENIINKLAQKGIITQNGGEFDFKKDLSKNESLTCLAKLLVVNDAANSKLDNKIVNKYLDPRDENFVFAATVGSMLKEDTLKTVSETDNMTRELFAEIINEVTSFKSSNNKVPFTDIEKSPYKEALEYCYNTGILIGTSENTMSPEKIITNGQMLQVLSRLDEKLSKEEAK